MKHSKNTLTALFSVLLFAVTGTAFAAYSAKPVTYIRQTCEDCYTCVIAPDNANTGEARDYATVDLFSFLDPAEETATVKNGFGNEAFTEMTYRKVFNAIKNAPEFAGKVISQGRIQLIQSLGNSGDIQFNFFPGDGSASQLEGETRLKTQDSFFAIQHGFAVGKTANGVNVRTLQPEFFPNPFVFTGSTERPAIQALYETGLMKILIDSTVYYQNYPIANFEESIYKEKSLPLTNVVVGGVQADGTNVYGRSTIVGDATGYRPLIPMLFYNGSTSIELSVKLSASVNMAGESSSTNYAIYRALGFYISGGALNSDKAKAVFARLSAGM